ncbi:MAG: hypothetical protein HPY44_13025 [Armatimonadetes bacterium]|nr:hypothetical protein [Armatimonadota bacterium]
MRSIVVLLAVVALCAIGPPSWAYYNPFEGYGGQNVTLKLYNFDAGTLYFGLNPGTTYNQAALDALPIWNGSGSPPAGPYKVLPTGSPIPTSGTASLEDSWGIVKLSDITLTDTNQQIWNAATSGWEITGIFYHEKDAEVTVDANSGQTNVYGKSLYAVFFAEPISGTFNDWTTTPNDRAFEKGAQLGAANRGTDGSGNPLPEMQGATESKDSTSYKKGVGTSPVPLWTFRSVLGDPGAKSSFTGTQFEYFSRYTTDSSGKIITGSGGALASTWVDPYWGEGVGNGQWSMHQLSTPGTPHNVKLSFTMNSTGYPWDVRSNDPIEGKVSPELSSASLMLVGLVPIGIVGWRRRKK